MAKRSATALDLNSVLVLKRRNERVFPPPKFRLKSTDLENPLEVKCDPVDWARQSRECSKRVLAQLKAQFVRTKNPIFAWSARAEAKSAGMVIPNWVEDYFDLAWENLRVLRRTPPRQRAIAPDIQRALGFINGGVMVANVRNAFADPNDLKKYAVQKKRGPKNPYLKKTEGGFNPFKQPDEFKLALAVYEEHLKAGPGLADTYAIDYASHTLGESVSKIRVAWVNYRDFCPRVIEQRTK